MKQPFLLISALLMFVLFAHSQGNIAKQAPQSFDSLRADIVHGKIDTISYISKTVGTKRRAIIYTPPIEYSIQHVKLYTY